MIAEASALSDLIARIQPVQEVALDTEADSLHCYFEKLCLIQLATEREQLLIDPLADLSMEELFAAFRCKRIVFHGADYDLRLLRRYGDFEPAEIFDTMIAARLVGEKQLGLAALVERHFGIVLSKGSQKANWGLRPLSPRMVEYALNDVRYLLDLARILEHELARLERRPWFEQCRTRMVESSRIKRERDEDGVWRITGAAKLPLRAQAVLRALWFWRDEEAQSWDRPPFHVMSNDDLLRISEKAEAGTPFSTPRFNSSRRKRFEEVLALALQLPENEWPVPRKGERRRVTRQEVLRFDELKKRRDLVAEGLGFDPSILAPRGALEQVAANEESDALMLWQRELLGLQPSKHAAVV